MDVVDSLRLGPTFSISASSAQLEMILILKRGKNLLKQLFREKGNFVMASTGHVRTLDVLRIEDFYFWVERVSWHDFTTRISSHWATHRCVVFWPHWTRQRGVKIRAKSHRTSFDSLQLVSVSLIYCWPRLKRIEPALCQTMSLVLENGKGTLQVDLMDDTAKSTPKLDLVLMLVHYIADTNNNNKVSFSHSCCIGVCQDIVSQTGRLYRW